LRAAADLAACSFGHLLQLIPIEDLDLAAWRIQDAAALQLCHLPADRLFAQAQQARDLPA